MGLLQGSDVDHWGAYGGSALHRNVVVIEAFSGDHSKNGPPVRLNRAFRIVTSKVMA